MVWLESLAVNGGSANWVQAGLLVPKYNPSARGKMESIPEANDRMGGEVGESVQ